MSSLRTYGIIMCLIFICALVVGIFIGRDTKKCNSPPTPTCPVCPPPPTCPVCPPTPKCPENLINIDTFIKLCKYIFVDKMKDMSVIAKNEMFNGIPIDEIFGEIAFLLVTKYKHVVECTMAEVELIYNSEYNRLKSAKDEYRRFPNINDVDGTKIDECVGKIMTGKENERLVTLIYDDLYIKVLANMKKSIEKDPKGMLIRDEADAREIISKLKEEIESKSRKDQLRRAVQFLFVMGNTIGRYSEERYEDTVRYVGNP